MPSFALLIPMSHIQQARSLQAARSHALEQIVGRDCLLRALEGLIRRGYAQGLNLVLRGHLEAV
jgi:hypothetical protein